MGGGLFVMDAAQTLSLAANSSGLPRIDLICAEIAWSRSGAATNSATAGALVAVTGTPNANPVAPSLPTSAKSPGVLWRTALATVPVPNGATTALLVPRDVRPLDNDSTTSSSATIAPPGAWSVPTASPWIVERFGDDVFMSGRLTRTTADITAGTEATFSGTQLIPTGYRPSRVVSAVLLPDSGSSILGHMTILTDGTVTYSQNLGTFPANGTLRIANTHWKTTD